MMNTETLPDAVGSPVERGVRPRAWAIFVDSGNARMWTTLQPHVQKLADAEGLTVTPLYDQPTLDAAVVDAARSVKEHRERLRTVVRTAIAVLERHGDEHGLCADLRRSLGA
jgi:hypothetical protein